MPYAKPDHELNKYLLNSYLERWHGLKEGDDGYAEARKKVIEEMPHLDPDDKIPRYFDVPTNLPKSA